MSRPIDMRKFTHLLPNPMLSRSTRQDKPDAELQLDTAAALGHSNPRLYTRITGDSHKKGSVTCSLDAVLTTGHVVVRGDKAGNRDSSRTSQRLARERHAASVQNCDSNEPEPFAMNATKPIKPEEYIIQRKHVDNALPRRKRQYLDLVDVECPKRSGGPKLDEMTNIHAPVQPVQPARMEAPAPKLGAREVNETQALIADHRVQSKTLKSRGLTSTDQRYELSRSKAEPETLLSVPQSRSTSHSMKCDGQRTKSVSKKQKEHSGVVEKQAVKPKPRKQPSTVDFTWQLPSDLLPGLPSSNVPKSQKRKYFQSLIPIDHARPQSLIEIVRSQLLSQTVEMIGTMHQMRKEIERLSLRNGLLEDRLADIESSSSSRRSVDKTRIASN